VATTDTKFLAFFKLNKTHPIAHNLIYSNIQITITGFLGFKVEMSKHIGASMQGIP
jgi:hypothetical protein